MLQLQPGDVPCYVLLSGLQVPRVIGKGGAIIRELRQESGATVDILDRQVPDALQSTGHRIALIKGGESAMHTAIIGLVRNLNGPQAMRHLEPSSAESAGVCEAELLLPEGCEHHFRDEKLLDDLGCSLGVAKVDGLPKHRRVRLRSPAVPGLQAAAWRIHELVLRLARTGTLSDRDFDLNDAAWDTLMASLQNRRGGGSPLPVRAAADTTLPALEPSRLPEGRALEAQAQAAHEARSRETSEQQERERKSQLRKAAAQQARERELRARESRELSARARDLWGRCSAIPKESPEYDKMSSEARKLDAQARAVWSRTMHGRDGAPPEPPQDEQDTAPSRSEVAIPEIQNNVSREAESKLLERARLQRQAEEAQARERQIRAAAMASGARQATEVAAPRPAPPCGDGMAPGRVYPQDAQQQRQQQREQQQEVQKLTVDHHDSLARLSHMSSSSVPELVAACGTRFSLPLLLPSLDVAAFLSSAQLGIATKTGAKLTPCRLPDGTATLEICGPPAANAVACLLVQEAIWMSGGYECL